MNISFTICSANHLPYAKSLGDSLIEHNRDYKFIIFLADDYIDIKNNLFKPHTIINVSEMNINNFEDMAEKYNIFELSCALKPFAADYILKTEPLCNQVYYFDSDILIFNKLIVAEDALKENSILLTPHICTYKIYEGVQEIEKNLLRTGIYNGGFFAIKRSNDTNDFLKWWMDRMQKFCFNDTSIGLFVDQLWLNFVPLIFKKVKIILDAGYNVAYWNLDERKLILKNEGYYVNERYPLVFYHFSGYDIKADVILSKHFPQQTFKKWPVCAYLFNLYKSKAEKNNVNYFELEPLIGKKPIPKIITPREKNFFKRKYKKWFLKK